MGHSIQNSELNEFSKIDCVHLLTAYSSNYISCSVCAMKIEAVLLYSKVTTILLKQSCQVVMMHMSEMSLKNV